MCVCVCVCERESVCLCALNELQGSTWIKKLNKKN